MKVELTKDNIYDNPGSTLKMLRFQHSLERKSYLMDNKRYTRESIFEQSNILEDQIARMGQQLNYKSLRDKSKASPRLKLYVFQQDRSLKKLKIGSGEQINEHPEINIDLSPIQPQGSIDIPDIKELFKDQKMQWIINQNKKIRSSINSNIESLKNTLNDIGAIQVKKKLPPLVVNQDQQLQSTRKLIKSLQKQKQYLKQSLNASVDSKYTKRNISLYEQKPLKQKIKLKGVKTITVAEKEANKEMLAPTYLLYQFRNIAQIKQRKQRQLSSLLKNSYLNRQDILNDKIKFYSKQTQYYDLSLSSQMHLRNIMKKKLAHRLDLSKRQVQLFVDMLKEIKSSHIIIQQGLIDLLAEIRDQLVNGRTIRKADFQKELLKKYSLNLQNAITKNIVSKLKYMMF